MKAASWPPFVPNAFEYFDLTDQGYEWPLLRKAFRTSDVIGKLHEVLQEQTEALQGVKTPARNASASAQSSLSAQGASCWATHAIRSQAQPRQLGLEYTPSLDLLVRTKIRPENLVPLISGEIRDLNRDIPITCHTMEDELAVLTLQPQFNAVLLEIFSGIALLLATVGIYGVLYSSMADRIAPRIRRTVDQPDS
ncbi:MAG: hypothetical protein DMG58_20610 [Acidobacteria bacterium]|nr:MAG: hypothetical protein DMG58_20610 [Acidobacteriota bacterium]